MGRLARGGLNRARQQTDKRRASIGRGTGVSQRRPRLPVPEFLGFREPLLSAVGVASLACGGGLLAVRAGDRARTAGRWLARQADYLVLDPSSLLTRDRKALPALLPGFDPAGGSGPIKLYRRREGPSSPERL